MKKTSEKKDLPIRMMLCVYFGSIAIWAFDFKAQQSGAGASIQGSLFLVYLGLSAVLGATAVRLKVCLGSMFFLNFAVALYIGDSFLVGMYANQPMYLLARNAIPPLIFCIGAAATFATLEIARDRPTAVLNIIVGASLFFSVVHLLVVGFIHGGIDFSRSRYEVISGALVPSLGLAAVALITNIRRIDAAVLLVNLGVLLVSVTRTLLVVILVQIVAVAICRPSVFCRSRTIRQAIILGLAVVLIISIDLVAGTGLTARWIGRITISQRLGFDPTALTRVAETKYMIDAFTKSLGSIVFGNGLAAPTSLIGKEALYVQIAQGRETVNFHSIGYGHEHPVSVLFIAGIFGGLSMLIVQFVNGIQACRTIRLLSLPSIDLSESTIRLGLWGSFSVIGIVSTGFFAGTFGERDICLWYGIGTGMLYWIRQQTVMVSARTPLSGENVGSIPRLC